MKCAACGIGEARHYFGQNEKDPGSLMYCKGCNHYQFNTPLGTQKYDKAYYEKFLAYEGTELAKHIVKARWDLVMKEFSLRSHPLHVLDYGCGAGTFIKAAPDHVAAYGYDVNPHTPYCKEPDGLPETVHALTLWDVIEHIWDPVGFLKATAELHDIDAVFITTPDTAGADKGIMQWKHFRPEEHQHYFSVGSLDRALTRAGFVMIHLDRYEAVLRDAEHPFNIMTVVAQRIK